MAARACLIAMRALRSRAAPARCRRFPFRRRAHYTALSRRIVAGRAGVVGSELMVRIGSDAAQRALERDHVRGMDFTGKPIKNMIFVEPAGLRGPALERWVTAAADYARTVAPQQPKHPGRRAHR